MKLAFGACLSGFVLLGVLNSASGAAAEEVDSKTLAPRAKEHSSVKVSSKPSESQPVAESQPDNVPASAKMLKGGTTNSSKYEDALAVECPQPTVPTEHQEQGIKTHLVARFTIEKDGKFNVALLSSTGSEEVDQLALETLRRWKFKPAMLDGAAVKSTRKIRIEFEIE